MIKRIVACVLVAGLALCASSWPGAAGAAEAKAEPRPNTGAFVAEIMHVDLTLQPVEGVRLVMWLPFEFFVASGMADPQKTRAEVERELVQIRPYLMVLVADSLEDDKGKRYETEAKLRTRATLTLPDGQELTPLERVPRDLRALAGMMKQQLAAQGDIAENLHMLLFRVQDAQGKLLVDFSTKQKVTLNLKAGEPFAAGAYSLRSPFDAMNPAAPCGKCKEPVSGKWSFCGWCGAKLAK